MAIAVHRPVKRRPRHPIHVVVTYHPVLAALAVLLALLLVVFLVSDRPGTVAPSVVQVGESDGISTVMLRTGDTLQVTLEGNISTGFTWEIAGYDEAVIRPVGEQQLVRRGNGLGAGEDVVTRFEAVGAGTTVVRMIYHRQFEEGVAPLKTFEVVVTVEGNAAR